MHKISRNTILIIASMLFFNSFALARRVHSPTEEARAFFAKVMMQFKTTPNVYPSEFQAYRPFLEAVLYGVHNEFKQWMAENISPLYIRRKLSAGSYESYMEIINQAIEEGAIFEVDTAYGGSSTPESRKKWLEENILSKGYVVVPSRAFDSYLEHGRDSFLVAPGQLIENVRVKFKEVYDKHVDIYLKSTGSVLPENDTYALVNFSMFYRADSEFWDGDEFSELIAYDVKVVYLFDDPRREFMERWDDFLFSYKAERTITAGEFCEELINFFHSPLAKDVRGMDNSGTIALGRFERLECTLTTMLIPGWYMHSFPIQDIALILNTIASLAREDEQLADYFCRVPKGFPVDGRWYESTWMPMAIASMQQDTEKALDALMTVLRRHEESGLDSMRRGFSTTANKFMHWEFVFLEICAEAIAMLRPKNETEKEMILSALEEIAEMDYLDPASRIARHVLDNREIVISAEPRRAEDYQVLLKYFEARNTYKVYTYAAARGDSLALLSLPWKNGEPQDIPTGIEYSPSLIYDKDDITIEKYYPDYPQFIPE